MAADQGVRLKFEKRALRWPRKSELKELREELGPWTLTDTNFAGGDVATTTIYGPAWLAPMRKRAEAGGSRRKRDAHIC